MVEVVFEFILFLLFLFLCLYLPGRYLFVKLKIDLSSPEDLFLPVGLGIVLFTLIAYLFSWVNLEILILPLFLFIDFLVIRSKKWRPKKLERNHFIPLAVVIILSIIFATPMVTTGKYGDTITYRHDDLWHLMLINELKAHFPPDNPGFAEVPLKGYHFFYNFVAAKVSNIFLISPLSLHFHLLPLFFAISWGIGVYTFLFRWSKKISVALFGVFLTQYGGSFAYFFYLQGRPLTDLNAGLGITQTWNFLYNPPSTISIIILITSLFALMHYLSTKQTRWLIPLVLCVGVVSMFKVYAGIILMVGFLVLTLVEVIRRRFVILLALVGVGILFLGTYWVFGSGAGYLIYYPLWAPNKLLQSFPWFGYEEKIYTYSRTSFIKLVAVEIYGVALFAFGNLGTRFVGIILLLFFFWKKRKYFSIFVAILIIMTVTSVAIPLFFIQSGKVFEIIQMTTYYLFFCSLFAAFGLGALWQMKYHISIKVLIVILIVIATLPSAYYEYTVTSSQKLPNSKFQAYQYLSQQGIYDDTILKVPPLSEGSNEIGLMGWYKSSVPEIDAFINKRSYLSNEYIEFSGVNLSERMQFLREVVLFNTTSEIDEGYMLERLHKNNIHYLYSTYPLKEIEGIEKIYAKEENFIYKVGK